jgi:hypothetical protein
MARTDSKANQDYSSIQRLRGKSMQQKPSHRNGTLNPDASKRARASHHLATARIEKMGYSGRTGFCSNRKTELPPQGGSPLVAGKQIKIHSGRCLRVGEHRLANLALRDPAFWRRFGFWLLEVGVFHLGG